VYILNTILLACVRKYLNLYMYIEVIINFMENIPAFLYKIVNRIISTCMCFTVVSIPRYSSISCRDLRLSYPNTLMTFRRSRPNALFYFPKRAARSLFMAGRDGGGGGGEATRKWLGKLNFRAGNV
jgi:hypothetical protein